LFGLFLDPENGDNMFFKIVSSFSTDFTVTHKRNLVFSFDYVKFGILIALAVV
jgi:hypothetical protein